MCLSIFMLETTTQFQGMQRYMYVLSSIIISATLDMLSNGAATTPVKLVVI